MADELQPTAPMPAPQPAAPPPPATEQEASQQQGPQDQPGPAAPARRSGISGLLDAVADMLAGPTERKVSIDENGKRVVEQAPRSKGDEWKQIGLEALTGAAAGSSVARGPGGPLRALGAGFGAEQQREKELRDRQDVQAEADYQREQTAKNNALNYRLMQQQLVTNTWNLENNKVKATQEMMDHAEKQREAELKNNSYDLGVYDSHASLPDILKKQPEAIQKLGVQALVAVPVYNPDGSSKGVQIFERRPDINHQPVGDDAKLYERIPDPTNPGKMITRVSTPINMTQLELNNANTKFHTDLQKEQSDATTDAYKQAQTLQAKSATAKNYAEAGLANENAKKTRLESAVLDGNGAGSLTHDQIIEGIYKGKIDLTKDVGMFRDPTARMRFVQEVIAKHPDWNQQTYDVKLGMQKDAASGKMGDQVQSFNSFLGHANNLSQSVNELRNSKSPLINRPVNWLKKNATGNPQISAILPEIEAVRNEFQNFLANHALTKDEIARGNEMMNEDQGLAAMQAGIKSFMKTALTRLGAVNERYKATMGEDLPNIITPNSAKAIEDLGLKPFAETIVFDRHPGSGAPAAQPQQQKVFSISAWKQGNPQGDEAAAEAAARAQNYQVVP